MVSDQSHHGPPFLAPPSWLAVSGPSPRRRASTSLHVLSCSSRTCQRLPLATALPTLERVGRPVLERQDAGGVGPVLERLAPGPPVGLLHLASAHGAQARVGHELMGAGQHRNGVELHRAEPPQHGRHASRAHPGAPQPLRVQGDPAGVLEAQRFRCHTRVLTRIGLNLPGVTPPRGTGAPCLGQRLGTPPRARHGGLSHAHD